MLTSRQTQRGTPEIDINPIELEAAQCIVFAEERREELEQKNLVVVNVSNSNSKKLGFYRCNGRKKKDVRKMGGGRALSNIRI